MSAVTSGPAPILPSFDGGCVCNVVPALLGATSAGGLPAAGGGGDGGRPHPSWMPDAVAGARQLVLLVLDGLGWEQLADRRSLAPVLAGGRGGPITTVAPSTTACALTSLSTGLPPSVHGVVGYRVHVSGKVLNVLAWRLDGVDARSTVPPATFQPFPTFPGAADGVPVVSRSDYAPTGFTAAHLGRTVLHAWHTPSGIAVEVGRLLAEGAPFVYAYYDGIDRVSHARGLGIHYDAELRAVDRLVSDLVAELVPGSVLVVTSDHGQVDVGRSVEVLDGAVMDGVVLLSGEGRFRWLHTRPGATDDVAAAAEAAYGHVAWVRTREQVIEDGWLGGEPVPAVADRLGDVLLAPFEPTAFLDPADVGELRLVGRHGSLTSAEMWVPLLAFPSGR